MRVGDMLEVLLMAEVLAVYKLLPELEVEAVLEVKVASELQKQAAHEQSVQLQTTLPNPLQSEGCHAGRCSRAGSFICSSWTL